MMDGSRSLISRILEDDKEISFDGDFINVKGDELDLKLSEFDVVRHHTFSEVEARVKGTYQGQVVDGTYVYADDQQRPRSEYYGIPDLGEDSPIVNVIDENSDVTAKIQTTLHDADQDDESNDDGFDAEAGDLSSEYPLDLQDIGDSYESVKRGNPTSKLSEALGLSADRKMRKAFKDFTRLGFAPSWQTDSSISLDIGGKSVVCWVDLDDGAYIVAILLDDGDVDNSRSKSEDDPTVDFASWVIATAPKL
jgi:hypothetical protein